MSYEKVKQAKRLTVGTKQTKKAVLGDLAESVVLASDASRVILKGIEEVCSDCKVPVNYVESMRLLGKVSGIQASATCVAILK